jgi:hypothetical protein
MSVIPHASCDWHAGFLKVLPAVETHARIRFRRLNADRREEAIQETIAAACLNFQLAAAQGKLNVVHPSSLADFAVRHVRTGRHVGGSQDAARDVMSPVCQRRHGVEVVSIDRDRLPASLRDGTDGWKRIAVADRKANIPDLSAFRIDFAGWLQTLTHRDREIICAFSGGDSTKAVAERFGLSEGRVSQLRRKFERLWHSFQGEAQAAA